MKKLPVLVAAAAMSLSVAACQGGTPQAETTIVVDEGGGAPPSDSVTPSVDSE